MKHLNFFHWHNRVELKPDTNVLQARWDAAVKFVEKLTSKDTCSLIRLALFGTITPEFGKRFSEALVAQEPTFPPEENVEILRVMATAALFSKMEDESEEADAVALGLHVAAFRPDRIQPVCKELAVRAAEYLASESERMRPTPKVESDYRALQKATETGERAEDAEATKLVGKAILELGETMGRIAEENQFLWWLLGRRSSILNKRREELSAKEYALLAGAEAADRVALLPPPASVESLIDEVLSQCAKATNSAVSLTDLIDAANIGNIVVANVGAEMGELCPLHMILGVRHSGGKADAAFFGKLSIPAKLKVSPTEAANQFFRELVFLRALAQLG